MKYSKTFLFGLVYLPRFPMGAVVFNRLKRCFSALLMLCFVLVFAAYFSDSSVYAQEYDDLYFSLKDRANIRKDRRQAAHSPEQQSSDFYYPELPSSGRTSGKSDKPEATASKFTNPDYSASGKSSSAVSYYTPPNPRTTFTNPRRFKGSAVSPGGGNTFNFYYPNYYAHSSFSDPWRHNFGPSFFSPYSMRPYWGSSLSWSLGSGLYSAWHFGVPSLSFYWGSGWGSSSSAYGSPFWHTYDPWHNFDRHHFGYGSNTYIIHNYYNAYSGNYRNPYRYENYRMPARVYRGPVARRSSVGTPHSESRQAENYVRTNNARSEMNKRYAQILDKRRTETQRTTQDVYITPEVEPETSESYTPQRRRPLTVNPNAYRRNTGSTPHQAEESRRSPEVYRKPARRNEFLRIFENNESSSNHRQGTNNNRRSGGGDFGRPSGRDSMRSSGSTGKNSTGSSPAGRRRR